MKVMVLRASSAFLSAQNEVCPLPASLLRHATPHPCLDDLHSAILQTHDSIMPGSCHGRTTSGALWVCVTGLCVRVRLGSRDSFMVRIGFMIRLEFRVSRVVLWCIMW